MNEGGRGGMQTLLFFSWFFADYVAAAKQWGYK